MQLSNGKTEKQLYDEVIKQIIHADQVGFDVYSLIDHHHFSRFSISANPLAIYTAVAHQTQHIRFRTALHILPQVNPLRMAGEIAVADILTNGRIDVGVGRGHAWVYSSIFIVTLATSMAMSRRLSGCMRSTWTMTRRKFARNPRSTSKTSSLETVRQPSLCQTATACSTPDSTSTPKAFWRNWQT
ncbi:LLM class flavin-dependent oxidoreductase [Brevibacillus invocatus]|uniref:LLM class flavin-dependent oxidoreductase n=1 Tax=Brevibacillus invocatus TaxID=173959 RepID=UPI0039A3B159